MTARCESLRAQGRVLAVGLAYAAQESAELLPREPTDAELDAVVTEAGVRIGAHLLSGG